MTLFSLFGAFRVCRSAQYTRFTSQWLSAKAAVEQEHFPLLWVWKIHVHFSLLCHLIYCISISSVLKTYPQKYKIDIMDTAKYPKHFLWHNLLFRTQLGLWRDFEKYNLTVQFKTEGGHLVYPDPSTCLMFISRNFFLPYLALLWIDSQFLVYCCLCFIIICLKKLGTFFLLKGWRGKGWLWLTWIL